MPSEKNSQSNDLEGIELENEEDFFEANMDNEEEEHRTVFEKEEDFFENNMNNSEHRTGVLEELENESDFFE